SAGGDPAGKTRRQRAPLGGISQGGFEPPGSKLSANRTPIPWFGANAGNGVGTGYCFFAWRSLPNSSSPLRAIIACRRRINNPCRRSRSSVASSLEPAPKRSRRGIGRSRGCSRKIGKVGRSQVRGLLKMKHLLSIEKLSRPEIQRILDA